MTRPAIIIGVGGAGIWTLTHLKKELQDSYGKVPDEVKLVGFDTILHSSVIAGAGTQNNQNETIDTKERKKQVGAVQLEDRKEYIHIGYDLNPTPEEQRALTGDTGKFQRLGAAGLYCVDGAAASRKLGRLCTVYDFAQGQNSRIVNKLVPVMNELNQRVKPPVAGPTEPDRKPLGLIDIFVIGSMAGGTGSGMLVDMGLICRYLKSIHLSNIPITLRAVVYTPRTFAPAPSKELGGTFAASFAAWRELDRFIVTNQYAGATRVRYDDNLVLSNNEFLYDVSYLVDPARGVNPLQSGQPENQLYPGVANAIAAMIDDQAGAKYAAEVVNILNTKSTNPNLTLHSALGSHEIKSARHYEEMTYTWLLAKKVLDDLLTPVFDAGQYQRLDGNRNPQSAPPRIGGQAANEFLVADNTLVNDLDENNAPRQAVYPNSKWDKLMAKAWTEKWSGGQDYIVKHASQNLADHHGGYRNLGPEDEAKMSSNWARQIFTEVKTSMDYKRDPRTPEEKTRIPKEIDDKRVEILTQYEMGLRNAHPVHVRLFKSRLSAQLHNILNGTLGDPIPDKTGRLGYALGFIQGLNKVVAEYAAYLKALQDLRATQGRLSTATGRESSAKQSYEKNIKECVVVYWDYGLHPKYREFQRNWFRAADARLREELKERLLTQEALTAAAYLTELVKTEASLSAWEEYLAKGKALARNKRVIGLYSSVDQELTNLGLNFENDVLHARVMDVLTAMTPDITVDHEIQVMKQISWSIVNSDTGVTCVLKAGKDVFVNQGAEEADGTNLDFLAKLINPYARNAMSSRTIGGDLKNFQATEQALGTHLSRKAEPLYQMAAAGVMYHDPAKTGHLCVNNDDGVFKYTDVVDELNGLEPATKPIYSFVPINDKGKLILLRTDDCIRSSDFGIYKMCKEKYIELANHPTEGNQTVDLHVFPAETNACQYEVEIAKMNGLEYKVLHPKVVALMDEVDKFEGFFKSKALSFIKVGGTKYSQNNESFWAFEYEREELNTQGKLVKKEDFIQLSAPFTGPADYYALINQFVIEGRDFRKGSAGIMEWEKLNARYNAQLNDNPDNRSKFIAAMNAELAEDGMVAQIMSAAKAAGANAKTAADQEVLDDLANVVRAVYVRLIEKQEAILESMKIQNEKTQKNPDPSEANKA